MAWALVFFPNESGKDWSYTPPNLVKVKESGNLRTLKGKQETFGDGPSHNLPVALLDPIDHVTLGFLGLQFPNSL